MLKLKVRKQGGEGGREGWMGGFHTCSFFFDMHKCGALTFTMWWMKTQCDTV